MADERRSKEAEAPVDRSAATHTQKRAGEASGAFVGDATAELSTKDPVPPQPGVVTFARGERIADRYVVLDELGRGGMSVVYLARDEKIHRLVAVKMLLAKGSPNATRRITREASASNALDAARVARVFDVGETSTGELYLVMEYVQGRTVRSLLRAGRVEHGEALRIVREVATALGEAHRSGLVHRDVKPDNVIVCKDGRVVVLDFGIVKYLASAENAVPFATQVTTKGAMLGTPAYLSPEQALGRAVVPAADQFALAVTAFELLSGSLPWNATEMTPMLAEVLQATPRALSSIATDLSPQLDAVFARALSRNPEERFSTVEDFGAALQLAMDGNYVAPRHAPSVPVLSRTRALVVFLTVLVAIGSLAAVWSRPRSRTSAPERDSVGEALAALAGPEGRLACPIFEVHGVPDVAVRFGAAAASLTCLRALWFLDGRGDRILPPAALLDAPRTPVPYFPDPFATPEQRSRTVDAARARASAYLDGTITAHAGGWIVSLVLRSPDAREIARGGGRDAKFQAALRSALLDLWKSPLVTRTIDPEVARWTGFADAAAGAIYADERFLQVFDDCDEVHRRGADLGSSFVMLDVMCTRFDHPGSVVWGPHALDESSPWALAASASSYSWADYPFPHAEGERLALKLEELHRREASRIGRARLAMLACRFWQDIHERDRAQSACLLAINEDPLSLDAWASLSIAAQDTGSAAPTLSIASAWFPASGRFLTSTRSLRGDQLAARLRDSRLAFLLEPLLPPAMSLGHALVEAGREDEARALAGAGVPEEKPEWTVALKSYLFGLIDIHSARLARGIANLDDAGDIGLTDMVPAARVAGRTADISTKWAMRFLSVPDEEAGRTASGYIASMALCMNARSDIAIRCLDRVTNLGRVTVNWWGDEGITLLNGAIRYARGDVRGAVAIWRPLVTSVDSVMLRVLPTEAFERANAPELAARLDRGKLPYTFLAGVSEAAPREAKRALAAGDTARAKDLAEKVVHAWEVADVDVPSVAEMRTLLKSIPQ